MKRGKEEKRVSFNTGIRVVNKLLISSYKLERAVYYSGKK